MRPTPRRQRTDPIPRPRLRRHCERVLDALALPERCGLDEIRARLPALTGRPLRVVLAVQTFPAPSGAWLRTAGGDVILIDREASPLHRDHILAHELAHILLGHDQPDGGSTSMILPDLDPAVVRGVLARHHYRDAEEREAELLASLIMVRGSRWRRPHTYLALQRLRPLWRDFAEAHDDIALERPRRRDDLLAGRDSGLRLYRRVIEICDGYRAVRRFISEPPLDSSTGGGRRPGVGEHLLHEAVALHRARLLRAMRVPPPPPPRRPANLALRPALPPAPREPSPLDAELARLEAHARARRYAAARAAGTLGLTAHRGEAGRA
ncbi:MAG: DUF6545 domain-containing protein [Candidatus Dormibacteria bacterium]